MSNKTIQLNPAFLSGGNSSTKSTTQKKERKEKPTTTVKPNKVKKQLLAKIKEFQNKTEKNKDDDISITCVTDTCETETDSIRDEPYRDTNDSDDNNKDNFDSSFENEFNKSLNFLSELSKQRKIKPKKNETLKKGRVEQEIHQQIAIDIPEEMREKKSVINKPLTVPLTNIQPLNVPQHVPQNVPQHVPISIKPPLIHPPAYSNLKNGTKPTYRQYHNKTQKNYGHIDNVKPLINIETSNVPVDVPANVPVAAIVHAPIVHAPILHAPTRFKKRITRTLKYSLGKHKNGKVSVLIKNAKTRRKVQTEQALLKQKTIPDIKLYLRSKNLLKVGSEVPNDVLRQMYENAILAGDITNKSKDTLIHNYFNDK
jgi:hypothetical protein